jgi:hypothetical protein
MGLGMLNGLDREVRRLQQHVLHLTTWHSH